MRDKQRLDEIAADLPRLQSLPFLEQLRDSGAAMKNVPLFAIKMLRTAANEIEQLTANKNTTEYQTEIDYQTEIERLRITDAEREALHHVVGDVADITGPVEETLRALLERTK